VEARALFASAVGLTLLLEFPNKNPERWLALPLAPIACPELSADARCSSVTLLESVARRVLSALAIAAWPSPHLLLGLRRPLRR
jgi:hypothetical protein